MINPRLLMMLGGISLVFKIISGYFTLKIWRSYKAGTLKTDAKDLWQRVKKRLTMH